LGKSKTISGLNSGRGIIFETSPSFFPRNRLPEFMKTPSSENLMGLIAEGDEYAFELLVRRHQTSILNFIYRFIGNRAQADDLAQEVFLRIWKAARTYEPKAKFTTWAYRIATNLCLNELKSPGRRCDQFRSSASEGGTGSEYVDENALSAEDLLLARERRRQISDALQTLPGNQRMALILKRYDDLTYQEISQIIGCSVSAVESLLVRAKKNLQENLARREK
jgi:RNA polymerase sigma-70 factor, ECF subfamily